MKRIILIILIFNSLLGIGQITNPGDPGFIFLHPNITKKLNIQEPNFDQIDLEIRIWFDCSHFFVLDLILLQINNEGNLSGTIYENLLGNNGEISNNKRIVDKDLDTLLNSIQKNNILTLPDGDSVLNQHIKTIEDALNTVDITDGTEYHFEIISQNGTRQYSYHCPKAHFKYDKIKIKEFELVLNILEALIKELKINHQICVNGTFEHTANIC